MHDSLNNQVEDLNTHNGIACTDQSHIILTIDELEITYLTIDSNGKVNNAADLQNLGWDSDLRPLFRARTLNHAHANITCLGIGVISFQPGLGYTF
jgi:hypothetical protein